MGSRSDEFIRHREGWQDGNVAFLSKFFDHLLSSTYWTVLRLCSLACGIRSVNHYYSHYLHKNVRYLCLVLCAVKAPLQFFLIVRFQVGKIEFVLLFTAGDRERIDQIQRRTLCTIVYTISKRCQIWQQHKHTHTNTQTNTHTSTHTCTLLKMYINYDNYDKTESVVKTVHVYDVNHFSRLGPYGRLRTIANPCPCSFTSSSCP